MCLVLIIQHLMIVNSFVLDQRIIQFVYEMLITTNKSNHSMDIHLLKVNRNNFVKIKLSYITKIFLENPQSHEKCKEEKNAFLLLKMIKVRTERLVSQYKCIPLKHFRRLNIFFFHKQESRKTYILIQFKFYFENQVLFEYNINNMDNQTTTQKSPEGQTNQTEQSQHTSQRNQHLITPFQYLKALPILLSLSQCVQYKHGLLICGGKDKSVCYSYHTIKNEYKFICEYPSHIKVESHCVVKLVDNNNEVTLLSFGGFCQHTLVMKYVSVCDDISNKLNELNNYNQWIPFTDNHNRPINIGSLNSTYIGARAVIGGSNNHLLFITHLYREISVFNLSKFKFIKHNFLPTYNYIEYHCFVSNSENGQGQEKIKTNKKNYQMLLFCKKAGLSIEYDEDKNTFQFHQLSVYDDIASLFKYAYVRINDAILFFGGCNASSCNASKLMHKYLIRENKWMPFQKALPDPLFDCAAILSEDNNIHIIGGNIDTSVTVSTHVNTKMCLCDPSQLVIICLFIYFFGDQTEINYIT
ncbi:hypothetical protein RFI_31866 [Reticulomyxa filosa]|uniref:Kelch motif family protein n=1 Tax=Reticulomyxa filosa TaxID=46433 RepID=X6LV92_RETFI|nr:hypothetical protein RFI_31866 [Reticulomyxa filosa]|eukprot:ETO05529.1 hypothetical protein RFI_31866 [Reticulomyxa filosa]